jgi:ubiquinone/menaquinone biosynthesis C-methylase UbiE
VLFFPARSNQTELLDEALINRAELAENFRDISRINRFFGGVSLVLRLLERVIAERADKEQRQISTLRLLDIATGAADIPLAISRWARGRNLEIEIVATDYSKDVLEIARSTVIGEPDIVLELADARMLPYDNGSFDIVICSLALHHFTDDEAVEVLGEMRRVARVAFIVNDLRRSVVGYLAAHIYGLLFTRSALTRNDAPLSVLRAFTTEELATLARRVNIGPVIIEKQPGWRLSVLGFTPSTSGHREP